MELIAASPSPTQHIEEVTTKKNNKRKKKKEIKQHGKNRDIPPTPFTKVQLPERVCCKETPPTL